jgi:hypothetical protein
MLDNRLIPLEVRAGIEPAYADLQSDASPLCHRTPGRRAVYRAPVAMGSRATRGSGQPSD